MSGYSQRSFRRDHHLVFARSKDDKGRALALEEGRHDIARLLTEIDGADLEVSKTAEREINSTLADPSKTLRPADVVGPRGSLHLGHWRQKTDRKGHGFGSR
jgi:hypothetical protein